MAAGFDKLAPHYDRLSGLFFGNQILKSQTHFLEVIEGRTKILVVGGGAGAFLPYLVSKSGVSVDFVDKSAEMIRQAKKGLKEPANINFIQVDFFQFKPENRYDLILIPFFLDMFLQPAIEKTAAIAGELSLPAGKLIVTDFLKQENFWSWKALTVKLMYLFFRFTCGIEAAELPEWKAAFVEQWKITDEAVFCHGMIGSTLFKRID